MIIIMHIMIIIFIIIINMIYIICLYLYMYERSERKDRNTCVCRQFDRHLCQSVQWKGVLWRVNYSFILGCRHQFARMNKLKFNSLPHKPFMWKGLSQSPRPVASPICEHKGREVYQLATPYVDIHIRAVSFKRGSVSLGIHSIIYVYIVCICICGCV